MEMLKRKNRTGGTPLWVILLILAGSFAAFLAGMYLLEIIFWPEG